MDGPPLLFCWYAPEDKRFFRAFEKHCAGLVRKREVVLWGEGCIGPGEDRKSAIDQRLREADLFVFLVSADFVALEECNRITGQAMKLRDAGTAQIVPIKVRDVELIEALSLVECLPRPPAPAIANSRGKDSAWVAIVREIRERASSILSSRRKAARPRSSAAAPEPVQFEIASDQQEKGRSYMYTGKLDEALQYLEASRQTFDGLLIDAAGRRDWRTERARLSDAIGQASYMLGDLDAARAEFDHAFTVRCDLLTTDPRDHALWRAISASRYWRGHLSFIQCDFPVAHEEQAKGIALCEKLLEETPGDADGVRDLVVLKTDLGTTLERLGRPEESATHLRDALDLARRQVKRHPENLRFKRDLSVSLFRLVDVLLALDRAAETLDLAEEAVRCCEEVIRGDPMNLQWRRHLASAHLRAGDVHVKRAAPKEARSAYRTALAIMDEIITNAPKHSQWLREREEARLKLDRLPGRPRRPPAPARTVRRA